MTRPTKDKSKHHKEAISYINQPKRPLHEKQHYDRIACVFQGGGALGAYQVGAYRAIRERGYLPNYLTGVSIGAINSAIVAGNPPETQLDKLTSFWETITPKLLVDAFFDFNMTDFAHHLHNQIGAMYSLLFGLEGFFKPRIFPPHPLTQDLPDNLSYYDTSELRHTLEKHIDFDRINQNKKITLCLGAVNITSGQMIFFNSQKCTITPEHVMASGALPPGFPAIKIGEDYYWDGGIYANTPLVTVLDALPQLDTLCFVVDCFSLQGRLPKTMDQIEERQKDIRYASHSRRLTNVYTVKQNLQAAIQFLGERLPPETKEDPEVKKILKLGHCKRLSIVHIIHHATPYSHSFKDYNFIEAVIKLRMDMGYQDASAVLDKPTWEQQSDKTLNCSIYGVRSDYFDQH
ncbi:patatin-like phospholipase family protein [Legionella sp. CNM-1927-20]|uniref:patatin-like phospholipase family protein n=1 Tax=Legionella sp. CNM-1927-20 TaxID=3422221 RepID=UPI00403A8626